MSNALVIRGVSVTEDENGYLRLDDIWRLAKAKPTRTPKHWRGNNAAKALIQALQQKVTHGYLKADKPNIPVIYAKRGKGNEGTYGHPVLAAAYAGYLSPKLEIEVRTVWLRYRAADPTLADEVLQRATAEANEWAGMRALGRAARKEYVDILVRHEVSGPGIGSCTNAIYQGIYGTNTQGLKDRMKIADTANLRDHFTTADLAYTMAAEMLAKEDIEESNHRGDKSCRKASSEAAKAIGKAIADNRAERRRQGTLAV